MAVPLPATIGYTVTYGATDVVVTNKLHIGIVGNPYNVILTVTIDGSDYTTWQDGTLTLQMAWDVSGGSPNSFANYTGGGST